VAAQSITSTDSLHSAEGDALVDEVRSAIGTLDRLLSHADQLGQPVVAHITKTSREVQTRLERSELFVVVVAEKRAGKTTLLNALLGAPVLPPQARDPAHATYLRARAAEGYLARRLDGTRVDFEQRHPDDTRELVARLEALEADNAGAAREREGAIAALAERRQMADQAQVELKGAFQSFEEARAEAERLQGQIAEVEAEKDVLRERAAGYERELPRLVQAFPPLWAIWLLLAYAVAVLLFYRRFRAWRETEREIEVLRSKSDRLKLAASEAAHACRRAELALDPIAEPAQATQAEVTSAKRGLGAIDSKLSQVATQLTELREQLAARRRARRELFLRELRELLAASGGAALLELEIAFPARYLPENVTIVDAAGVTAEDPAQRERAWETIREKADGCILVSELERAVTGSTLGFLQQLREVVPHVLLVLSKIDESFMAARRQGVVEPWDYVEHARRIATRRFAEEIGREPEGVLSIAVAAEIALEDVESSGLLRRFEAEVTKLFQLLRQERALILGTRAASLVQGCIDGTYEAEDRAERYYEQQIRRLEELKRPEPEQFRRDQLALAQPAILEAAALVTSDARQALHGSVRAALGEAKKRLETAKTTSQLVALAPALEQELERAMARVTAEVNRDVGLGIDAAVRKIELRVFDALRQRYEISHLVTRGSNPSIHFDSGISAPPRSFALEAEFAQVARSFRTVRIGLGGAGSAGGALAVALASGSWLIALSGVAAGALLAFARTPQSLSRQALQRVDAALQAPEAELSRQLSAAEAAIATAIGNALDDSVARAIGRFDPWIAEPLEAEKSAIARERERLVDLQALRERLLLHREQLELLVEAASRASFGLCR